MFPLELWDHVVDFLWTDPPTLLSCALTCKAWLPASQHHLRRQTTMTIRNETMLKCIANVLCSRRSRRLFELVETVRVVEDPTRPFVRTVPFRLPASALPALTRIVMENICWMIPAQEPHHQFFESLSVLARAHEKGAGAIELVQCRFRRVHAYARRLESR
ncbi:uncharacterized protein C8Q71DRAFT_277088 [Rhodofomes roseus]|uniref:F-box domain-containing protein n=1 Tax=Rhodofomes roseus TaxID=34475 RepID=A0ABQ8K515_9APHY|nr:uncharacterized protein C8Q71DRAFT_277088 [Rhodofomes roseus]KAH9832012.1 hypothetical protein C8Q71DRAFT_277088 [Rhodofomes roseus]